MDYTIEMKIQYEIKKYEKPKNSCIAPMGLNWLSNAHRK